MRLKNLLPAIVALPLLALIGPIDVNAGNYGSPCATNRTYVNYSAYYNWDGWEYPGGSNTSTPITGVWSNITTYANHYDSATDASSAFDYSWVMLTQIGSSGGVPYAQIGYATGPAPNSSAISYSGWDPQIMVQYIAFLNGKPSVVTEWATWITNQGSYQVENASLVASTQNWYTVLFGNTGASQFSFDFAPDGTNAQVLFAGGQMIGGNLGWTPYQAQVYGETLDNVDQQFGDIVTPETFSGTEYYASGAAHPFNDGVISNQPHATITDSYTPDAYAIPEQFYNNPYNGYLLGGDGETLSIWDNACPNSATSGQSDLVSGGTFPVLDASGTGNNHSIESGAAYWGPFSLQAQTSGNLVLYNNAGYVVWDPEIMTSDPTYSIMQSDCNYVLYDAWGNTPLFNTGTSGHGSGCSLQMQNDGNLVVYNSSGTAEWDTGSNWASSYYNSDPSVLYYGQKFYIGDELWSGNGAYELVLQPDYNLVLYHNGTAIWSTASGGYYGSCVEVEQSGSYVGQLTLWNGNCDASSVVWSSGNGGGQPYSHLVVGNGGDLFLEQASQIDGQNVWNVS